MSSNRLRTSSLPVLLTTAVLLMVGLRLVALASDPYVRLDWCTGLLTDEGYYSHNARNQVLFGHPATDEFNNRLLSPLLHLVQVGVFSRLGSGLVPARLVSVVGSLLTLLLFYAALRRAFGLPVARLGTLFLGLDHVNLLFNRLALMDTPAALLAVAAFYAYVRAGEERGEAGERSGKRETRHGWLVVCGMLLGLTLVTRSLCVYLLPVPFLAGGRRQRRRAETGEEARLPLGGLAAGLALVLVVYALTWGLPHRAELGAMNAYYRQMQIQSRSVPDFFLTLARNFGDPARGRLPYLAAHSPVLLALVVYGFLRRSRTRPVPAERFLRGWLLSGTLLLMLLRYAPHRYDITLFPAFAALAALSLHRLPQPSARARLPLVLLLWAGVNGAWLLHWGVTLSYEQAAMTRWVAEALPPHSVLLGAVAPGLAFDSPFVAVNVQPGLCNDDHPVERFLPPRGTGQAYILLLDADDREPYWTARYPDLVAPERCLKRARILGWTVGIYPAQ